MTERLYYRDPYLTTFDATVVSTAMIHGRPHVVLDRTAFYPSSGGQPFDVGTLGDARVLDVIDRDEGRIEHVVDRPLADGARVSGTIDWPRRFDHMQQHTGQHVLSAAFDTLFGVRTESFHLGITASTIDLAREVTRDEIARAEAESNRVVWEDRAVTIRFASAEEAASLPLRKESVRSGSLRLIEISEFDLSACGGTHVARTGAIGVIAVAGFEKLRGGTRLQFLCGGRALAQFHAWRDGFAATMRHLSVSVDELPAGVERLQNDNKTLQKRIRSLEEQLAGHEARALVTRGQQIGGQLVIAEALEGWGAAGLKALAMAAAALEPSAAVALFSVSTPALVVIARGSAAAIDAGAVLKNLVTTFGGKGGGKPDLAQGGGLDAPAETLVRAARDLLTNT